jgi:hypothetical protein
VNVVECLAKGDAAHPRFSLRLTVTVEGDRGIGVYAPSRGVSPTQFDIYRRVDAVGKYRKQVVSKSSCLNPAGKDVIPRDDTDRATAHATAYQRASEPAHFAGSVTIPRLTSAYQIGDRISAVDGRKMSLRTGVGGAQGEGATYPSVVALTFQFRDRQSTTLQLSDERAVPGRPGMEI